VIDLTFRARPRRRSRRARRKYLRVPPKPLWRCPAQRDSIVMLASAVANGRCVAHAPVARVAKTHRSRVAHPLRAVGTGESSATSSGEASEGPAPPALDSEVRRSRRARRAREATRARDDARDDAVVLRTTARGRKVARRAKTRAGSAEIARARERPYPLARD